LLVRFARVMLMLPIEKNSLCGKNFAAVCAVLCLAFVWGGVVHGADDGNGVGVAQEKLRSLITYSCVNKPIEEVLDELSEQVKLCIVRSPEVTGPVTLRVFDVPLEEVLSNVLAANNYTYVATNSMVRVVPLSEAATLREEMVTEVYQITYADVNGVALSLQNFLSDTGRIAVNAGTSHIVVTDTADRVKAVGKFIEQIDRETKQVLVEVRIYDIIMNDAFEIATKWNVARNADTVKTTHTGTTTSSGVSGSETKGSTDTDTSTGIPLDYVGVVPVFSDTAISDKTDTWTSNESTNIGETIKQWDRKRSKPVFGGSFDKKDGGTISISLLNNAVDLSFVLSMLHSLEEAKLLANPRVMVLDNETALFETVREIPYTERTTTAGSAGTITSTKFKPVGVKLNVTPHIARDGMIRLKIEPEFGVVVDLNSEGAPTIDTRRALTTNIVKDGQTIVLGGLRKSEMRKEVDKVPLLGDMPVLGALFRGETESEITTELVVFITTSIVQAPELSAVEEIRLDATDQMISSMSKKAYKSEASGSSEPNGNIEQVGDDYIEKWMDAKRKKAQEE